MLGSCSKDTWTEQRDELIEDKEIIIILPSIQENRGIRHSHSVLNRRAG
jgi:hypothetical protein